MKINANSTTTNTNPKKSYDPIPKGRYLATLDRVGEKSTKDGTGTYIDCVFKVTEGKFARRLIFHKFHIKNKSAQCQEIGTEQLNKFLKCAGEYNGFDGIGFDSSALGKYTNEVQINVDIEAGNNGYADRNKITSFSVR